MKQEKWMILIILVFLTGCASQQQPAPLVQQERKFFTPRNWQQPIQTPPPVRSVAASDSLSPAAPAQISPRQATPEQNKIDFRPDFSKQPANVAMEQPPQQLSNDDGFKPEFSSAVSSVPPSEKAEQAFEDKEQMEGFASWYGPGFHGKETANGEKYNQTQMTAAHKILPMNTWVQVKNLENNRVAVVRINDRGPYKKNRIIDLTQKAAQTLGFEDKGTAMVSLKVLQYPKDFDPAQGLDPYKQVVVQIAVFKGEQRAYDFHRQLTQQYRHIPFSIDDRKESTFQVFAGPYEERSQALKIANALKADGIDNFVRSYRK